MHELSTQTREHLSLLPLFLDVAAANVSTAGNRYN